MAAKTSFKQQCPHCEAIVPVKDESLIGKRIRCPKCGEPFLLEDPEGSAKTTKTAKAPKAAASAAATKAKTKSRGRKGDEDDEDQPQFKKKKGGGNNKLIIGGLALAGVAVVLLAVAVFFMNSGDNKPKSGPNVAQNNPPPPVEEPIKQELPVTAKAGGFSLGGNISNMLPNDTQVVVNVPIPDVLKNPVGQMLFDNYAASTKTSETALGIGYRDVERWIITMRLTDPGWTFLIWRTKKPINFEAAKRVLQLKPAKAEGSPVQGQDFYATPVNWLTNAKIVPAILKPETGDAANPEQEAPFFVHKRDDFTLVIANLLPMKEFLKAKGQPTYKDTSAKPEEKKPGSSGLPAGVGRGGPPRGAGGFPGGDAQARVSADYRSINPRLKAMLDRMETNSPYLVSGAVDFEGDPLVEIALEQLGRKEKVNTGGFSLQWRQEIITAMAALDCGSDQDASNLRNALQTQLQLYSTLLKPFGVNIKTGRERRPENKPEESPGGPGGERGPGGVPLPPGVGRRPPGVGPGQPSNPGPNQPVEKGPPANVTLAYELNTQGRLLTAITDIKLRDELYEELIRDVEPYFVRLQGELEMATARPHPQRLADAGRAFAEKENQFPRGAADRKKSAARAGRKWNPDQRISWMAEILPYLGYERAHSRIVWEKSWRDPENLTTASILIPEFVDASSSKNRWYVSYPGVSSELAATQYVGMAGIGLDAPSYRISDPAVADKLGIFGYDRVTPLADIVDKAKTILMIQVPPTLHSPWMAGGGSTVRGVPETGSVAPFVTVNGDGQRGTTVIMADGSVHWISEKISDDVFKAMCRVKGRKSDVKANELHAIPPPDEQSELKAVPGVPTAAAPPEKKEPTPAAPEKKQEANIPPPGK